MLSPNPAGLTERQMEVVCAIRQYRHVHGISPTYRELARSLGIVHVAIAEHVWALAQKRIVRCEKGKARSLEIVREDVLPPLVKNTRIEYRGEVNGSPTPIPAPIPIAGAGIILGGR